jgi:hypothetical protein
MEFFQDDIATHDDNQKLLRFLNSCYRERISRLKSMFSPYTLVGIHFVKISH